MQILSHHSDSLILSHGSASIELPLGLFILDFQVDEKLCRGDRLLTARHRDDPVPGAGAVHPFLGYLNVCPAELLDLDDGLPRRAEDGAYQALAHLNVDLGQLLLGVHPGWRWRRWEGVAGGGQAE